MSHRLFGTDGVRGKAGDYPLDHETVATAGGGARPCDARVDRARRGTALRFLVGRDTRESGEWIERELARGVHSAGGGNHDRRRHPDPCHRLRDPCHGLRRRARDFRIAQPVRGQRHQGVLGHAVRSSPRGSSARSRRSSHDKSWQVAGSADVPVESTDVIDAYIAHALLAFPDPQRLGAFRIGHRHGQRRDDDRRTEALQRSLDSTWSCSAPRRTAGTSTSIADRPIPEQLSRDGARTGLPDGRRVRRRRRSRDLRRCVRADRGWRRRAADVRDGTCRRAAG